MGTNILEFWRTKIKKEWKIAFFSVLIIGLVVHMYKFTNYLPTHDSVYSYYSAQNIAQSGRWFLRFACLFSSYFDLPWVLGILSLLFLGITAVIVVELFKMKNPCLIVLSSAMLVTFPALTETFFFLYTADGYMLGMLLAVLAAYLTRFESTSLCGYIIGGICICLSCAIYQSYVPLSLILTICCFVLTLLKDSTITFKSCAKFIGKQLLMYCVALVVYWGIWKLVMHLNGWAVTTYKGINTLAFSFDTILAAFSNAFHDLSMFFFETDILKCVFTPSVYSILNLLFLVSSSVALVAIIIKQKLYKRPVCFILVIIALALIPFIVCMWSFASISLGNHRPMMLYSLFGLYVFAAVLIEDFFKNIRWKNVFAVLLCLICLNNALCANIAYKHMDAMYDNTYATAAEMLSRIHMLDTESDKIAVIGKLDTYLSNSNRPEKDSIHLLSMSLRTNIMSSSEHIYRFINYTFNCDYANASADEVTKLQALPEVKEMGIWPASDSVQVIDDTIVIKLSEPEGD